MVACRSCYRLRHRPKLRITAPDVRCGEPGARAFGILGEFSRRRFIYRVTAENVPQQRSRECDFPGCRAVGIQTAVESIRDPLHAASHADISGAEVAQSFVEPGEHCVDESLREIALSTGFQALKHQEGVQSHQIKTAVDRVGDVKLREKDWIARACDKRRSQSDGGLPALSRFGEGLQHGSLPTPTSLARTELGG